MSSGAAMLSAAACLACCLCSGLSGAFAGPSRPQQGAAHHGPVRGGPRPAAASSAGAPGASFGAAFSAGVFAASGAALRSAARRSRLAARALPGSPSLIQVLEQKGLLSTVEKLGLLSAAENAGVGIATPERLGLLRFAEERNLLTLAEDVLTDRGAPFKALVASLALGAAAFSIASTEVAPDVEFTQGVFAGALGVPAVVVFGAAVVIFGIAGGTSRTVDIDIEDTVVEYKPNVGFQSQKVKKAVSLLSVVEQKRLLSFLESNRLLSLAASLGATAGITRPLTLTEQQGVLSKLEQSRLLSFLEGTASDTFAAARILLVAVALLAGAGVAAFTIENGAIFALLLALLGLGAFILALVLGVLQSPKIPTK